MPYIHGNYITPYFSLVGEELKWDNTSFFLDMGLFSLYGCKGFGDLIVGSGLEVSGWLQNLGFFFFFFFGDIFWLFPTVMLHQISVCFDTKIDAGQPEQN